MKCPNVQWPWRNMLESVSGLRKQPIRWKEPGEHAHFTGCLRKWEVLCLNQSERSRTAEFRWVDQVHPWVSRHSKGPEGGARASHLSFWVQHSNRSLGGSLCLCACSPQPSGLTLCNVDWRLLRALSHDSRALLFLSMTARTCFYCEAFRRNRLRLFLEMHIKECQRNKTNKQKAKKKAICHLKVQCKNLAHFFLILVKS